MKKIQVFLSHKVADEEVAQQIKVGIEKALPPLDIYVCEEITKGTLFNTDIWRALKSSRLFILLFTDPKADWSWCLFEAGAYRALFPTRPIYCIHSNAVPPPSPLADYQTVKCDVADITRWINDISTTLRRRAATAERVEDAAIEIHRAISRRAIFTEAFIKPYIWITPSFPDERLAAGSDIPVVAIENASVSIDPQSAVRLGFKITPKDMRFLDFLQALDFDSREGDLQRPFWIDRFIRSVSNTLLTHLKVQEVAYFRHEDGSILRPMVVSIETPQEGITPSLRLRIFFAHAFSAPMNTASISAVQYLADGIRLGIRTRNEVLKRFSGDLSKMTEERSLRDKEHGLYLGAGVGSLIKESLGAILEEASANGMGLDPNAARHLFSDPAQQSEYESIRKKGIGIFNDLNATATAEDQAAMHNYERTEKLLVDLKAINERYLRLAIPQLNRLLAEETTTAPQALD